ncbi:MAG TPA: type 4a pilus biogenesis protein PilO [Blastocatellia bacterium]|nr:type 4a pilus biogenesis protein PilO [Blastocatellia bacterium]
MSASAQTIVKPADEQGNFFTRQAWYVQMLVLLVLAGLLYFAADYLLYSDKRAETGKIKEQVETLKAKNQQASIIQQNLKAAEATLAEKREEIDRLRDLLPDAVEISRIYDSLKDLLRAQRLELKRFSPAKAEMKEFYTAQPILIEVTGSYDALGQYFSELGFYRRILSVSEVDIKQAEDGAQELGRSINSSFVVTAYYISPENLEKLTARKPVAPPAPGTQTDQKK